MSSTVLFNDPTGTPDEQYAIINALLQDINDAPAGTHIEICVYTFSVERVAQALGKAAARGCIVRCVVDHHVKSHAVQRLKEKLGRHPGCGLHFVKGAARWRGGNTHAKVWKFLYPDGSYHIWVGSSNISGGAAIKQYQDMVRLSGNSSTLRGGFVALFEDQWKGKPVAEPYVRWEGDGYAVNAFPMPHHTRENDPVVHRFNWLDKHAEQARVCVAMHGFNGARGNYLASRLIQAANKGADVRVILGIGTGSQVRHMLQHSPVRTKEGHWKNGLHIHHKLMFVGTPDVHAGPTFRVWTGSDNWSDDSFKHEEIDLRVTNDCVRPYINHFEKIWDRA